MQGVPALSLSGVYSSPGRQSTCATFGDRHVMYAAKSSLHEPYTAAREDWCTDIWPRKVSLKRTPAQRTQTQKTFRPVMQELAVALAHMKLSK